MKVTNKEWRDGCLCIICPKCDNILASASKDCVEALPDYSYCYCKDKFKVYQENGKTMIEHFVYPRFKAEITFKSEGASDFEEIEMIDNCKNKMELAGAMRAAGEFLIKGHQE